MGDDFHAVLQQTMVQGFDPYAHAGQTYCLAPAREGAKVVAVDMLSGAETIAKVQQAGAKKATSLGLQRSPCGRALLE